MATRTEFILLLVTAFFASSCDLNRQTVRQESRSVFQELTGSDTDEERESWNAKYREKKYTRNTKPDSLLRNHLHLIPKGKVLLFPLEDGSNAVFLASQGFQVWGIDYSDAAIQKAYRLARASRVSITGINANLEQYEFEPNHYDAIVAIDFYRPRLIEQVKRGLKKNGIVFYVNTIAKLQNTKSGAESLGDVKPGELEKLFSDFKIIVSKTIEPENADGKASALIIARKP